MEKKDLVNLLDEVFLPLGFKRKGNNWVINGDEISKIINLQKSNFGDSFYINYDFIIRGLELTTRTHVPHRLASSNRTEQKLITNLLDLETDLPPEDRLSQLKGFILAKILPLVRSINTEKDIYDYLKSRPHLYDVPLIVKEHFKLE